MNGESSWVRQYVDTDDSAIWPSCLVDKVFNKTKSPWHLDQRSMLTHTWNIRIGESLPFVGFDFFKIHMM